MRRHWMPVAAAAAALLTTVAWAAPAAAQQSSGATTSSPSVRSRGSRSAPQGFSVVLVVGDITGPGGEDTVPPAARRALADMKDFLPYKSFKLVDAAWITGTSHVVSRMRGPDDRDYELEITASANPTARLASNGGQDSRLSVSFALRDTGAGQEGAVGADQAAIGEATARLSIQLERLRDQQRVARARDSGSNPDVVRLEREISALEAQLQASERRVQQRIEAQLQEAEQRQGQRRSSALAHTGGRAVMNTSFTMELGETVVVGTSRLSGTGKALIALLTAVPPKSARP